MRLAIDISETIDGYRLDILEEGKVPYRINPQTKQEAMRSLHEYLRKNHAPKPPIQTMDVI